MTDEERALDILRAVVNTMRTTGATGEEVIATCRRIVAEIRAEEREAAAKVADDSDVEGAWSIADKIRARGQP